MCDIYNRAIEFSSESTFYILLIALETLCVQSKQSMRSSFNLKITAVSFLLKMSLNCEVVKDTGWQFLMLLSTVTSLGACQFCATFFRNKWERVGHSTSVVAAEIFLKTEI